MKFSGPGNNFRIKVVMEVPFEPMKVGLTWDSKAETGMVGLENLGATCYLNALLQVGHSTLKTIYVAGL